MTEMTAVMTDKVVGNMTASIGCSRWPRKVTGVVTEPTLFVRLSSPNVSGRSVCPPTDPPVG